MKETSSKTQQFCSCVETFLVNPTSEIRPKALQDPSEGLTFTLAPSVLVLRHFIIASPPSRRCPWLGRCHLVVNVYDQLLINGTEALTRPIKTMASSETLCVYWNRDNGVSKVLTLSCPDDSDASPNTWDYPCALWSWLC